MKNVFLFFCLVGISTGWAHESPKPENKSLPKIVLLTSLNLTTMKPIFFQERYRTYNLKLEQQFREHFPQRYRLEVRHFIRQNELWEAVRSQDTAALILVAHAGSDAEQVAGIHRAALVDLYGYDMTAVLQGIHPEMKFLGIVGCDYKKNLDLLVKTQLIKPNPNLSTLFFDKEIDPTEGLKKTLVELDRALKRESFSQLPPDPILTKALPIIVEIKRIIPATENEVYHPPIRIETARGQVLGVLPRAVAGETQSLRIEVSKPLRKLVVTAGNNPFVLPEDVRLGNFQFESPSLKGHWTVFTNTEGQPLGTVSHVYRYNEE